MLATVAAERRSGTPAPEGAGAEAEELPELAERSDWRLTDRWLSLLLLVAVAAVWLYFSPLLQ